MDSPKLRSLFVPDQIPGSQLEKLDEQLLEKLDEQLQGKVWVGNKTL